MVQPSGGLGLPGVAQGAAHAGGGGDGGPLDAPGNLLFLGGLVAPGVFFLGRDVGFVSPGIRLALELSRWNPALPVGDVHHLQGQIVPAGKLGAAVVGQAAGLRGDHGDGVLNGGDSLCGAIGHLLGLGRGGSRFAQNIPHGLVVFTGVVHQPPDVLAVLHAGALPLRAGVHVDVVLALPAHRLGGGVALRGEDRLAPVQSQLRGQHPSGQAGVGLRVGVVGLNGPTGQRGVCVGVFHVGLHRVLDGAHRGDTRAGHADLQPLLIGHRQHGIQLEGVELVGLRRHGHALAAALILRVLDDHQQLFAAHMALHAVGVPGGGEDANLLQLVRLRVPDARYLDAHGHILIRPGDALDGQRVLPAIRQLRQLHQVPPRVADGAECAGDGQEPPRRKLGQQAGTGIRHRRFRPARGFTLFRHSLPPVN